MRHLYIQYHSLTWADMVAKGWITVTVNAAGVALMYLPPRGSQLGNPAPEGGTDALRG